MKLGSLIVLFALMFATPALVETASAKGMKMEEPSKEVRAKMATMHEQMAACLKSDKKFSECHDQMMSSCPMMKDGKCPMMMHHDHGGKKGAGDGHSGHAH